MESLHPDPIGTAFGEATLEQSLKRNHPLRRAAPARMLAPDRPVFYVSLCGIH